ncbi:hypothetical protein ACFQZT_27590 [Paenibacillus sp. GCM10027628]|uniref:hypothetical protein n=1 Tax=Paenibacillus sp. GCM10027628 TaxID=3273413 RepID=UPI003634553B
MNNTDLVYCVECNSISTRNNAEKIFKTGYFKTTIPLGHCKECACAEIKELNIEIVSGTQECYSDYTVPVSLLA